jgi:hypothetical protein
LKEGGIHCSTWWKSFSRIREGTCEGVGSWLENNIRRAVGDGRGTLFWHYIWVGEFPLKRKFPRLFVLSVNKECSVEEMVRVGAVAASPFIGLEGGECAGVLFVTS